MVLALLRHHQVLLDTIIDMNWMAYLTRQTLLVMYLIMFLLEPIRLLRIIPHKLRLHQAYFFLRILVLVMVLFLVRILEVMPTRIKQQVLPVEGIQIETSMTSNIALPMKLLRHLELGLVQTITQTQRIQAVGFW